MQVIDAGGRAQAKVGINDIYRERVGTRGQLLQITLTNPCLTSANGPKPNKTQQAKGDLFVFRTLI